MKKNPKANVFVWKDKRGRVDKQSRVNIEREPAGTAALSGGFGRSAAIWAADIRLRHLSGG